MAKFPDHKAKQNNKTKSTFSSHKHSYYVSQNFNVDSRENFMASEPHTPNPTQRRILL